MLIITIIQIHKFYLYFVASKHDPNNTSIYNLHFHLILKISIQSVQPNLYPKSNNKHPTFSTLLPLFICPIFIKCSAMSKCTYIFSSFILLSCFFLQKARICSVTLFTPPIFLYFLSLSRRIKDEERKSLFISSLLLSTYTQKQVCNRNLLLLSLLFSAQMHKYMATGQNNRFVCCSALKHFHIRPWCNLFPSYLSSIF